MIRQRTLKDAISITGIGVHTGKKVTMTLRPAQIDTGIVFRRVDLDKPVEIKALATNVSDTQLSSSLVAGDVRISTIEHLMATFAGLGIDNVYVDIDAAEIPIMDGSASPFVFLIRSVGLVEQAALKKFVRVKRKIKVTDGDKWASLTPFAGFKLTTTINFSQPVFCNHPQTATLDFARDSFARDLSRARTFGSLADYEYLRAHNLARGSSIDNTVVVDDFKVINQDGLRYNDEFVKHKMLDSLGDLYQVGHNLIGAFASYKSGHHLNNLLVRELLAHPESWEIVTFADEKQKLPLSCFSLNLATLAF